MHLLDYFMCLIFPKTSHSAVRKGRVVFNSLYTNHTNYLNILVEICHITSVCFICWIFIIRLVTTRA